MGAAGFGGSFAPIVQYEKWEIHPVFPHFSYFRLGQNTARISLPHYAVLPLLYCHPGFSSTVRIREKAPEMKIHKIIIFFPSAPAKKQGNAAFARCILPGQGLK